MNKKQKFLLNLELKQYNKLRNYAFKKRVSMTSVVKEAIIKYFKK